MDKILVKNISKKHRGIFAKSDIKKGEIIETCPVIVIPLKDQKLIDRTFVFNYYFRWGSRNQPALALGYGALYNHSYTPNARYDQNVKKKIIVFKAIRNIKKGEEILTNYNGNPEDQSEIWFKVKEKF